MDKNKYSHTQNKYDRPDFPYRCGRGVLWLKPCHQGPTINGRCGGKTECAPYIDSDRWVCNRPQIAGGPCEEGPTPEGNCCKVHPPCVPKYNLKTYRRRLAKLAAATIFALICVSWMADQFKGNYLSFNPGPVSSPHVQSAEKEGCQVCHESHRKSPFNWIKSVAVSVDISSKCGDCHLFAGPEDKAHNGDVVKFPRLQETQCLMCHREHKGDDLITRTFTSGQCNICHEKQFKSFSKGHPEFSDDFPYSNNVNSIDFNHITHLEKYFVDPKHSDKVLPGGCMGCHQLENDKIIVSKKFEAICADCHKSQILSKDLVLVRLPELDKNRIDRKTVMEACGVLNKSSSAKKEDEEFLSISTDTPTLTTAYLLNIPEDDPEGYSQKLQDLILALALESTMPLAKLIDEHSPKPIAEKMLAGLNPEVIKRAACAWGLNAEYDPPAKPTFGGWHADLLEVRYTPVDHKDPVALSWVEFALNVPSSETDPVKKARALAMRDHLLSSKKGVGGCIKCHILKAAAVKDKENNPSIFWGYSEFKSSPYVKYSHKSHLDVLGNEEACKTCHILKEGSKIDPEPDEEKPNVMNPKPLASNFSSINRGTCLECHTQGKVKQDCQLCHLYHLEPKIKGKILLAENQPR